MPAKRSLPAVSCILLLCCTLMKVARTRDLCYFEGGRSESLPLLHAVQEIWLLLTDALTSHHCSGDLIFHGRYIFLFGSIEHHGES